MAIGVVGKQYQGAAFVGTINDSKQPKKGRVENTSLL
jgi:hypothetical protein